MPAAQERGTRDTHCSFTTMSGPNRWSKSTGSTAQGSKDPNPTVPEEEPYRSEDSECDYEPPEGYAARKSHISWTEPSRHVPRKTTWDFVLPSDRSVHGTMTRSLSIS